MFESDVVCGLSAEDMKTGHYGRLLKFILFFRSVANDYGFAQMFSSAAAQSVSFGVADKDLTIEHNEHEQNGDPEQ